MKKSLLNYCGLLGIVAFLSYTAAVVFSPMNRLYQGFGSDTLYKMKIACLQYESNKNHNVICTKI